MTQAQMAEMAKTSGRKAMLNTKLIVWPPTRESFKLLCKALNLEISESQILEAIVCCRGPKLEQEPEEKFSIDKLTQWFVNNLKLLKHLDYDNADPDWLQENGHISRNNVLRFKTPLNRPHISNPHGFLRKTPDWDKLGY